MIKTEKKYKEFGKLGQKLGVPVFEAFLTLEVFDKDGKVIQKHRQRSHSWVRNAYNALFSIMAGKDLDDSTFGAGLLSIKDTSNVVRYDDKPLGYYAYSIDTAASGEPNGYMAIAAEDGNGILVGSGTNAESFEDYILQTKIVNGTAAGQMSYVASQAHSITWTGGTLTLANALARYFNNNSGGNVSVNEVALVNRFYYPGVNKKAVMARDHLASTVTVPDTGQLKVTYTISLVYPS